MGANLLARMFAPLSAGSETLKRSALLWRAGLPALGGEAPLKPKNALYQADRDCRFTTAAQPNAGKPARHKGHLRSSTLAM